MSQARQVRIVLHTPDGEVITSVWATAGAVDADGAAFTLIHAPYPDLSPAVGWHILSRLGHFEVRVVKEGILFCRRLGGDS